METTTGDRRLSPRARRALPQIVTALLVIAGASLAYTQPSLPQLPRLPRPSAPAKAAGPALLSFDYVASYSFVSASLGWAVVGGQSGVPKFSVFKTTDGAKHWKRLLVHQINAPSVDPVQVRFFDQSRGVIAVSDPPQIYRTADGGAHWTPLRSPAGSHATFFAADPLHSWFGGWIDALDQGAPTLFSTSDGGDTWAALGHPPAWSFSRSGGYASFAFRGNGEGWLGASAAEPTVYSSSDGGASWKPHTLPNNMEPNLCPGKGLPPGAKGMFMTDVSLLPKIGLLVISSDYCGQQEGYASLDNGNSWRLLAPPPGATTWYDFRYQDPSHWWAMRLGALWKSSDAGASWKLMNRQNDNWDYSPHLIDANHAWAELFSAAPDQVAGMGLALTSDGGLHWSQVSPPKPG